MKNLLLCIVLSGCTEIRIHVISMPRELNAAWDILRNDCNAENYPDIIQIDGTGLLLAIDAEALEARKSSAMYFNEAGDMVILPPPNVPIGLPGGSRTYNDEGTAVWMAQAVARYAGLEFTESGIMKSVFPENCSEHPCHCLVKSLKEQNKLKVPKG